MVEHELTREVVSQAVIDFVRSTDERIRAIKSFGAFAIVDEFPVGPNQAGTALQEIQTGLEIVGEFIGAYNLSIMYSGHPVHGVMLSSDVKYSLALVTSHDAAQAQQALVPFEPNKELIFR